MAGGFHEQDGVVAAGAGAAPQGVAGELHAGGVARLVVRYGERGLPRLVAIDRSFMIADEEATYRASGLRAIR